MSTGGALPEDDRVWAARRMVEQHERSWAGQPPGCKTCLDARAPSDECPEYLRARLLIDNLPPSG